MGLETAALIAVIAGAAASVGTTAYAASKGGPNLPTPKQPLPPPAVPPPPAQVPAAPTETEAGEAVARERRKRIGRFGVEQTMLTTPLGGGRATGGSAGSLLGG
jgi:hypothetical protein